MSVIPSKNSTFVISLPVTSSESFTLPPGNAWLKLADKIPVASISLLVAI